MLNEGEQWRVIEGDCLEVLKSLPDGCVDAFIFDPPFGTEGLGGGYGRHQPHSLNGRDGRTIANDRDLSVLRGIAQEIPRLLVDGDGWACVWCAARTRHEATCILADAGGEPFGEVIWDKGAPGLGYTIRYSHETALIVRFGEPGRREPLISLMRDTSVDTTQHPHKKPESIIGQLSSFSCPPGGVVLDPCCGVGSTGAACVAAGFRFLGIEIEPKYAAIARRRIADAAPLFVRSPEPDPMLIETLKEPKPC